MNTLKAEPDSAARSFFLEKKRGNHILQVKFEPSGLPPIRARSF
jgi:hypothetical protein